MHFKIFYLNNFFYSCQFVKDIFSYKQIYKINFKKLFESFNERDCTYKKKSTYISFSVSLQDIQSSWKLTTSKLFLVRQSDFSPARSALLLTLCTRRAPYNGAD